MRSENTTADRFFSCTQCGQCCRGYGGTYVSEKDIAVIGTYLGLASSIIQKKYCVLSGGRHVLTQRSDGFCIFWNGNCSIHPVKPVMCRKWPFIAGLRVDIGNWQVMAGMCPGIRRDIPPDLLLAYLDTLRSSEVPSLSTSDRQLQR